MGRTGCVTQSFELAQWYITALTGNLDTPCDWRCIHDTDKGKAAHNMRGTIREMFPALQHYNQTGWGIFVSINAMDGQGRELANVHHIRAHVVDLDDPLTSQASYQRAIAAHPQPHFAVQSSPGKFHLYWLMEPYAGNDFYQMQQRKLAQIYDGDKSIIDSTRVLRVPGFYHLKANPHLTTCWGLHSNRRWTAQEMMDALANVNVINHIAVRSPLGDPEMKAPSLEWLKFALDLLNPNDLDRQEWLSISAAFKQAGWMLTDEQTLLAIWQQWCAKYAKDDHAENMKMWNSIRDTEVGWAAFERRTTVKAYLMHHGIQNTPALPPPMPTANSNSSPDAPRYGDILSAEECAEYFKGCIKVTRSGEIFSPRGRYMNSTQFNMMYGGKHFIITQAGKTTDEPWKAATRSTVLSLPEVDHVRFLPQEPPMAIIYDKMKRPGLNTYIPVQVDAKPGDVTPWLKHIEKILPLESDRNILFSYMAHCVKYPGHKIMWAILLQSAEGVGKGLFHEIMKHCLGSMYIYSPKAPELVSSGSKFNAWMRGKLCIIVDEIKIDERRELIEILKPMITDKQIEVQAKGVDQEMEDNPSNWIFFSNYKDAIPINKNGRRYAVFFSVLQTAYDIERAGMDDAYFNTLFRWLEKEGGLQAINHWLLNYPIERGALPVRAPRTSSHDEALRISRSPMQIIVEEALQDNLQGFRGGYVSNLAVMKRVAAAGVKTPAAHSVRTLLESMGYSELGRAKQAYMLEDMVTRPIIYVNDGTLTLEGYAKAQGYEF
jgi:hypothetical protein